MMKVSLQQIKTGFKGEFCYTHARIMLTPDGFGIITSQPLRLSGTDVFYGMEMMTSTDNGATWSNFRKSSVITRVKLGNGFERVMSDATPFYHRATGKILLIGHSVLYLNDRVAPAPRQRHTLWSVYDESTQDWSGINALGMPDQEKFFSCGSGCAQVTELANGDLLIPVYFTSREGTLASGKLSSSMIMKCRFDGKDLQLVEYGNALTVPVPRGLGEPSIMEYNGEYFIALRNDQKGYVSKSSDGLQLEPQKVLSFDDGSEVENYCTQQHWFKCAGKLFMVYTRRAGNNDHVFRHRAPLFFAEFDTKNMCLIRSTEQIAVPERGARLGNFGCLNVSDNEAWVIAAEWMQTTAPDQGNWQRCMSYGSDNSIFIARITP